MQTVMHALKATTIATAALAAALPIAAMAFGGCDNRYLVGVVDGPDDQMTVRGTGGSAAGTGGASAGTGGTGAPPSGAGGAAALLACGVAPPPPRPLTLAPAEIADRLTQFLWGTASDAAIRARTVVSSFRTTADVRALAEAMLTDPRSTATVDGFARAWLQLDNISFVNPQSLPDLDGLLRADMVEEAVRQIRHFTLETNGTFGDLLLSPTTFVNERLAPFYGIATLPAAGWQQVALHPAQRAGVATQLGLMTIKPRATTRGIWVRSRLFCRDVAPPPEDAPTTPPVPMITLPTYRQRLAQDLLTGTSCSGCHQLMDPQGFAFEHLDDVGRFRATENGEAIDSSGSIVTPAGNAITFDGPRALMEGLAATCEARSCFAQSWLAQTPGRALRPDDASDLASVQIALGAFEQSGLRLRALIVAVTETPAFYR